MLKAAANLYIDPDSPVIPPPPNVISNFSSSYTGIQVVFIVFSSLYLALTTLVLAARLTAKVRGLKLIQAEDCMFSSFI